MLVLLIFLLFHISRSYKIDGLAYLVKKSANPSPQYMYYAKNSSVCMPPEFTQKWVKKNDTHSEYTTCESNTNCTSSCSNPVIIANEDTYEWFQDTFAVTGNPQPWYTLTVPGGISTTKKKVYFTIHYAPNLGYCTQNFEDIWYVEYHGTEVTSIPCDGTKESLEMDVYIGEVIFCKSLPESDWIRSTYKVEPCFQARMPWGFGSMTNFDQKGFYCWDGSVADAPMCEESSGSTLAFSGFGILCFFCVLCNLLL